MWAFIPCDSWPACSGNNLICWPVSKLRAGSSPSHARERRRAKRSGGKESGEEVPRKLTFLSHGEAYFPFVMLTVDAIIGNQAFQNGRYYICSSLVLDKVKTDFN